MKGKQTKECALYGLQTTTDCQLVIHETKQIQLCCFKTNERNIKEPVNELTKFSDINQSQVSVIIS